MGRIERPFGWFLLPPQSFGSSSDEITKLLVHRLLARIARPLGKPPPSPIFWLVIRWDYWTPGPPPFGAFIVLITPTFKCWLSIKEYYQSNQPLQPYRFIPYPFQPISPSALRQIGFIHTNSLSCGSSKATTPFNHTNLSNTYFLGKRVKSALPNQLLAQRQMCPLQSIWICRIHSQLSTHNYPTVTNPFHPTTYQTFRSSPDVTDWINLSNPLTMTCPTETNPFHLWPNSDGHWL